VNTGCPTLWNLSPEHCQNISVDKADSVVTSLNTFFPNKNLDGTLLRTLAHHYREIYFWIQNPADYGYAKQFGVDLVFLDPTVPALDQFLSSHGNLDYVGNRLHAGIRALQHGVRTLIVEVDNRAKMMGVDWGLPTVARDGFDEMASWISASKKLDLRLPLREIEDWKRQFYA
jgi:polysaccharide pyruvyl transferase WcaK-like protein